MLRHDFFRSDGRLVKLLSSSTLADKSPRTFIYFTTFEKKKKESGLPYQDNQTFWFIVKFHLFWLYEYL